MRNKVARHRRASAQRVRARGGDSGKNFPEPESRESPPDAAWEAAFQETLLLVLLDVVRAGMTPRTYQAFELFALHDLPGAEVARLTGMSRNAVYQARKEVYRRLRDLGQTYRDNGQLDRQIQEALKVRPGAARERSLTTRIAKTMQSG